MSSYYSYTSKSFTSNPYKMSYRKSYGFILFAIILLIMSWEAQKMDAAVAVGQIPEEAIRLRILANSDNPADQVVKRLVRDRIVQAMDGWVTGPQTIEEARRTITAHMPEIERIAAEVLESRGFSYGSSAELGIVPFPTKMYGNKVYPAGDYEALRITLGAGEGQNWWCVLFPPLCFIDAASGEAVAAPAEVSAQADTAGAQPEKAVQAPAAEASSEASAPEAKFFLWEMIKSLIEWIKSLFH